MKTKILTRIATITTLIALVATSSACLWIIHQPKEPKSLRKVN